MQEYVFKVQATTQHGHDEDRLITVGKVKIDMAQFAMLGHKEHHTVLQMPFTAGKSFTQALPFGQLRLKISAHMVKVLSTNDSLGRLRCCKRLYRFYRRILHFLIAAMTITYTQLNILPAALDADSNHSCALACMTTPVASCICQCTLQVLQHISSVSIQICTSHRRQTIVLTVDYELSQWTSIS